MSDPTITQPTEEAPNRGNPSTFRVRFDYFAAWVYNFAAELLLLITWIATKVSEINLNVAAALDARDQANAAALAAASSAAPWVSGGSYSVGDEHWSPDNYATYRAKTNHSGVTTDPSLDTTNWGPANPSVVADSPTITGVTTLTATAEITDALTAGAAVTLDKETANDFSLTTNANTTITVTNTPTGKAWVATLLVTFGGAHTLAITSADWGDAGPPVGLGSGDIIEIGLRGVGSTFRASELWRKSA